MLPYITVVGLALPVPALTLLVGIWIGTALAEKNAHRHIIKAENLYNLVFTALIAGIIGARLAYVIRFPAAFTTNPASLISLNFGLFDMVGGVAIGLIAAVVYSQRRNMSLWPTLDALTPVFAVFAVALSLSNLASGNAYGAPTKLPWGIDLWGAARHPTQIYETLGAGLILWCLWPGRLKSNLKPGIIFMQFVALSAISRLFFEAFRGDSLVTANNLRVAQIIAWMVLALSLWGIFRLLWNQRPSKKSGKMSL